MQPQWVVEVTALSTKGNLNSLKVRIKSTKSTNKINASFITPLPREENAKRQN